MDNAKHTSTDIAEQHLVDFLYRRHRKKLGPFDWLAFAIECEPLIEAFDRTSTKLNEAPIYLPQREQCQAIQKEFSIANFWENPSITPPERLALIQKALDALTALPASFQATRHAAEQKLRKIHSQAAQELGYPVDRVELLLLLAIDFQTIDCLFVGALWEYYSQAKQTAPLPATMAFRAAYVRRLRCETAAAVLMFSGRFAGSWDELCTIAKKYFEEQQEATAPELGPFDRKPTGEAPRPGLVLVRRRPFTGIPMTVRDVQTGRKWQGCAGGQWLWITPQELERSPSRFFTPEQADEHDQLWRQMDRSTPEYEKTVIDQWEQQQKRITFDYCGQIGELKLHKWKHPPEKWPEIEAEIAQGVAKLEKEMSAALDAFEKKNPRPKKQACKGCGILFVPDHAHEHYHSVACGGRKRQQRHAKNVQRQAKDIGTKVLLKGMNAQKKILTKHCKKEHEGRSVPGCSTCKVLIEAMSALGDVSKPDKKSP